MAPLGVLSLAWTAAEDWLPLGWQTNGLYRVGNVWIALAGGPELDDYASRTGKFAEQALRRLSAGVGAAGTNLGEGRRGRAN